MMSKMSKTGLKKCRLRKNFQEQGVSILRNEAYRDVVAMTKDEAQRSIWIFYEIVAI